MSVDELSLIDELIAKEENQTVDFKKSDILSDPIKLATLMVAFANTSGGRILIGVCDDGTLERMKAKKEHEPHIMNIARDRCDPPPIPSFSMIKKPQGDIYVIKVLRYRTFPHAVKTKDGRVYFIRVGSTVREAGPNELALLFEASKEELTKKPKLELKLIDQEGNAGRDIHAKPIFVEIKKVKGTFPASPIYSIMKKQMELGKQLKSVLYPFAEKKPSEELVPIGIEASNVGEAPAYGIRIFLKFPRECELVSERDAIGGLRFLIDHGISSRGLFVDPEESEASAWIDTLGNDLIMRNFEKVYVRFPEKEQEYKIEADLTQHNYPPEHLEFKIMVEPKRVEKVEYVYEEGSGKGATESNRVQE